MAKKTKKLLKHVEPETPWPRKNSDALANPNFIPIRAVDKNGVETPLPGAEAVTFILGAHVVRLTTGFGPTLHIDCADARPVPCAGNHRRLTVELYP